MYKAGDVRVENVPDPVLREPTDAIVRVTSACICGSDLWPYQSMPANEQGRRMGHEFIGIVEELGSEVSGFAPGDLVVAPFVWSDNTCDFCTAGLQIACRHGGGWGEPGVDAGQGEAVRVPLAQGTLVKLAVAPDSALMPSLLTLSDVYCTGHHGAVTAGVRPGRSVTVVGDGAVGLCGVLAAKRLGAEQIILMGRHQDRTALGREFGATDVVAARGEEGIERVLELTRGDGTHAVLECVGTLPSIETAVKVARSGGAISRIGVPQYTEGPLGFDTVFRNVSFTGGAAPARAYIEELMPDILDGTVEPGRVFDRTVGLDEVPDGYKAMAARESLKVLIRP
jgi:threonine dehydrogenase-like Zn-dependent dehydrogenase